MIQNDLDAIESDLELIGNDLEAIEIDLDAIQSDLETIESDLDAILGPKKWIPSFPFLFFLSISL